MALGYTVCHCASHSWPACLSAELPSMWLTSLLHALLQLVAGTKASLLVQGVILGPPFNKLNGKPRQLQQLTDPALACLPSLRSAALLIHLVCHAVQHLIHCCLKLASRLQARQVRQSQAESVHPLMYTTVHASYLLYGSHMHINKAPITQSIICRSPGYITT